MDLQDAPNETSVSELLEIAQSKARKLTPTERRNVIKYIEDAGYRDPSGAAKDLTNYELAAMFGVNEKIIRLDKRKLLKEYTALITPEDAMSFVGEFSKGHDDLLKRAYKGLNAAPDGTLAHQNYLKIISDLLKRKVGMLQEIGAIPKELGNLNVNEELWEAYVVDDGNGNATSGVKRVAIPTHVLTGDSDADPEDGEVFEADFKEI